VFKQFYQEATITKYNSRTKAKGVVTLMIAVNNNGRENL